MDYSSAITIAMTRIATVDIDVLRRFIADARQACQDSNAALSLPGSESELVQLQQAARGGTVER
jgi:hypothetical protein